MSVLIIWCGSLLCVLLLLTLLRTLLNLFPLTESTGLLSVSVRTEFILWSEKWLSNPVGHTM